MIKNQILATAFYTLLALIAFAANSVLCRLALNTSSIDPTSFTIVRLLSGAAILWLCLCKTEPSISKYQGGSWLSAAMLFAYAASFSYAYVLLDTGVGALILFSMVQLTIIFASLYGGERLGYKKWLGLLVAFLGFTFLMMSGRDHQEATINVYGVLLMAVSGVAWGAYTLLGKGSLDPLRDTANNFFRTLPMIFTLFLAFLFEPASVSTDGLVLALVAGALTSGLGYAIWYLALRGLTRIQSGVVQFSVPIIAALGGILFVDEPLSQKLVIALIAILGGIFIVVTAPNEK